LLWLFSETSFLYPPDFIYYFFQFLLSTIKKKKKQDAFGDQGKAADIHGSAGKTGNAGEIAETAKASIDGQLKALSCYKLINFFDGNKLVDLVDVYGCVFPCQP
jgi:hypothetical protein